METGMIFLRLYSLLLLSVFFGQGMDMPKSTSQTQKLPARPSTPLVEFLSGFNFTLVDQITLIPCKATVMQSPSYVLTSEDDVLEDSLWMRKLDS